MTSVQRTNVNGLGFSFAKVPFFLGGTPEPAQFRHIRKVKTEDRSKDHTIHVLWPIRSKHKK